MQINMLSYIHLLTQFTLVWFGCTHLS